MGHYINKDIKIYIDYEENVIENYNFQGFAEQLIAILKGWAEEPQKEKEKE